MSLASDEIKRSFYSMWDILNYERLKNVQQKFGLWQKSSFVAVIPSPSVIWRGYCFIYLNRVVTVRMIDIMYTEHLKKHFVLMRR